MLGAMATIQIRKRRRIRVMVLEVCCFIDGLIELASIQKQKSPVRGFLTIDLAEAVRFELTDPFESPVFKTGAIDHSATLPAGEIVTLF